ncbi:MAG TPA: enoyl-CoA hydratase/isomerase family protein [Dehalococcoidia bacterium]|nr:enoyl-CoA hydratase/isomerase family protein [Dehalococcoidia bacterium]
MTGAEELVLYRKTDAIAEIVLNRPDRLNAINLEMRDLLWTYFQAIRDDDDVRAVVVSGRGKAFSAGADISEFGTAPSLVESRRGRRERDLWGLLLSIEKPLVAAVHGYALGAGCEMSLCCDFRVATRDARFGLPEVRLGYIPSAGGTQLLPRTVRGSLARQMIMSGLPIDAEAAFKAGLVSDLVDGSGETLSAAYALAARLAARPARPLAAAKRALAISRETTLSSGVAAERAIASSVGA